MNKNNSYDHHDFVRASLVDDVLQFQLAVDRFPAHLQPDARPVVEHQVARLPTAANTVQFPLGRVLETETVPAEKCVFAGSRHCTSHMTISVMLRASRAIAVHAMATSAIPAA